MISKIKILMATQTGSAEEVADEVKETIEAEGYSVDYHDLADESNLRFLSDATFLIGVVSTWGDGEPPDDAVPFFDLLRESPPMGFAKTPIAIMGLGDSGYDIFNGCGKELEKELIRHGGYSIIPRVDCDVWYEDELSQWLNDLRQTLASQGATLSSP